MYTYFNVFAYRCSHQENNKQNIEKEIQLEKRLQDTLDADGLGNYFDKDKEVKFMCAFKVSHK